MAQNQNIFKNIDYILLLLYLFFIIFGWINIYSATYNPEHSSIFDLSQRYGKQLLWISLSLITFFTILLIDSKFFSFIAYPTYLLSVFLLIIVFFLAKEINGARSWITIGTFKLQPAEFTKIAVALTLAKIMSKQNFSFKKNSNLLLVSIILFLPMALILLQNDMGSALVYTSFIILLYRKGLNATIVLLIFSMIILFFLTLIFFKLPIFITLAIIFTILLYLLEKSKKEAIWEIVIYIFLILSSISTQYFLFPHNKYYSHAIFLSSILYFVGLTTFFIIRLKRKLILLPLLFAFLFSYSYSINFIYNTILEPHQRTRINVLLGIEEDPLGTGYNVRQSKITIGSGGLTGKGFLQGTQTKFNFVPEQSTDFIFCTVGEEYGFVGSSILLILYLVFIIRIIFVAERQRSEFSKLYGYAIASVFFFHFALNIGMTIGLMPVIGIPLPFLSYGGSSILAFSSMLAILLRLDINRNEIIT